MQEPGESEETRKPSQYHELASFPSALHGAGAGRGSAESNGFLHSVEAVLSEAGLLPRDFWLYLGYDALAFAIQQRTQPESSSMLGSRSWTSARGT